jgi:GT2 family glycosyltransferase
LAAVNAASVNADTVPDVSVVILTLGDRPEQLRSAIDSALAQRHIAVDVVIVANGVRASDVDVVDDPRVRVIDTDENLGIPGGRNVGAEHARAALLAFLDDDARYADTEILTRVVVTFEREPDLGVIALRIVDDDGVTARRHVPRIGGGQPDRTRCVTSFLGGSAVIRRTAFEQAGRYAGDFRYAMEESDLALRLIDRGWSIRYEGNPSVVHPKTDPSRHPDAAEHTMRNRVWLAYRNLPVPIAAGYVANWFAISTVRDPRSLGALIRGARQGWRSRPRDQRAPIEWRTVAELIRLGRPPII